MATCRVCPAQIVWVTNGGTGRPMILDPEPTPKGNVVVNWPTLQAEVIGDPMERRVLADNGQALYMDHHVTCASALRVNAGELVGQETLF